MAARTTQAVLALLATAGCGMGAGFEGHCINVVSYNVFDRPFYISHDGQTERMAQIPDRLLAAVPDANVVVFNEAFTTPGRATLQAGMEQRGFVSFSQVPWKLHPRIVLNGGVFVASRWPIVEERQGVFQNAIFSDKYGAKGFIYAKLRAPTGRHYHLMATHLQAWNDPRAAEIRRLQAKEMVEFVRGLQLPASQPVIYAGDFNADLIHEPEEIKALVEAFDATLAKITGDVTATSDPKSNILVGQTGGEHESKLSEQLYNYAERLCPGCRREWLDYILPSRSGPQPTSQSLQGIALKAAAPFKACMSAKAQPWHVTAESWWCSAPRTISDLSDHYPVHAKFCY